MKRRYYHLTVIDADYNHKYTRRYADTPNALMDCLRFIQRIKASYPNNVCKLASNCVSYKVHSFTHQIETQYKG